ncbi:MAG: ABC transporter permease [Myxococcota bacterium]|nr:ABC transporter permease [Myxococcota bacterium]
MATGTHLASMAWRNLLRHRRRTLLTLSSIALGISLAILFTGLGDSNYTKMIHAAAKMGAGHVTFEHLDYRALPSLKRTIRNIDEKCATALKNPDVTRAVPRITGAAMLATSANNVGVSFIAVDPAKEGIQTLSVIEAISTGEMFKTAKDKGIIVGEGLARNLDVHLGSKIVYTLTDKRGEIITGLARVTGIIKTGAPSLDQGLSLLPLDTIREAIGYAPDEATQVAVFLGDQRKSRAVASRLQPTASDATAVLTWRETQPDLAGFISMKVAGAVFFEVLIMVLVAAGIFNTLFVSVMERLREFGILLAIGFSPFRLFRLVMWESLWLALTGVITAAAVTAWPYYHLNQVGIDMSAMVQQNVEVAGVGVDAIMRVAIFPENAALIVIAAIMATLLSGLYPAWRASRTEPVETIKLV